MNTKTQTDFSHSRTEANSYSYTFRENIIQSPLQRNRKHTIIHKEIHKNKHKHTQIQNTYIHTNSLIQTYTYSAK